MGKRVCPWWIGYLLLNPFRRWRQDPEKIVGPYVREGMMVLEPGPGMGFFTVELLRRVGKSGRVATVDLQPKMLAKLKSRAEVAGVASALDLRVGSSTSMGIADLAGKVDFTLAFAVVHEFPSADVFFRQIGEASKTGAQVLLAEPRGHVKEHEFEDEIKAAAANGLTVRGQVKISGSRAVLLQKS